MVNQTLRGRAEAIAQHMEGWHYAEEQPLDRVARIEKDDDSGAKISIRYAAKERIGVYGVYPDSIRDGDRIYDFRPYKEFPRITVAKTRTDEAIAKDIVRRFIPGYVPIYLRLIEERRSRIQTMDWERAKAEEIAAMLPENAKGNTVYCYDRLLGSIEVKVDGCKETATVKLHDIPYALALRVVQLVAARWKAKLISRAQEVRDER